MQQFAAPNDPLPDDLRTALCRHAARLGCFAGHVRYVVETSSTSDLAARLAAEGAGEGTTVVAGAQTAGRGRLGRRWFSPAGAGLYASVVFRPPDLAPLLTLMSGVALAEALRRCAGLPVEIEWPNDLVVERAAPGGTRSRRKLGGILAEACQSPTARPTVILGFGINLRDVERPDDLAARATSIEGELDRVVDRSTVLVESLAGLARWYATLVAGHTGAVLERWRDLSPSSEGAAVELDGLGARRRGTTAGVDETGALLVRVDGGIERRVGGDVRWLGS